MAFLCSGGGGGDLGLSRTHHTKYAHYQSDGHGRDTYILKNNGGLCQERDPYFIESTRYPSPVRFMGPPAHRKQIWSIKYQSDGSGRDSYVLIDSGGNHVPVQLGGTYRGYENSLRRESFVKRVLPQPKQIQEKRDFHYWQNWFRPEQQNQMRQSMYKSKQLFERLATPKKIARVRSSTPSTRAQTQNDHNYLSESFQNLPLQKQIDVNQSINFDNKQINAPMQIQNFARRFSHSINNTTRNKSAINLNQNRQLFQNNTMNFANENNQNDKNISLLHLNNDKINKNNEYAPEGYMQHKVFGTKSYSLLQNQKRGLVHQSHDFTRPKSNLNVATMDVKMKQQDEYKRAKEVTQSMSVLDNLKNMMRQRKALDHLTKSQK